MVPLCPVGHSGLILDSMLDGDASAKNIPLSIESKTLPCLTRTAGLDEAMTNDFLGYRLPHLKIQVQYNEETDKPEFISEINDILSTFLRT
jgi:hypothetical protein